MDASSIVIQRVALSFLVLAFLVVPVVSQPIQIKDYADLCKIGADTINYPLNGDYEQVADIDASPSWTANGGAGFVPVGSQDRPFSGVFNGNGHKISGLYINRPDVTNGRNVGLFGYVDSASITRLVVAADTVVGNTAVGVLVGRAENSVFDSCVASGVVSSTANNAGGLFGSAFNVVVTRSGTSGTVIGMGRLGGLIGYANGGQVSGCRSSCAVELSSNSNSYRENQLGGLIGYSGVRVTDSYSNGSIKNGYHQIGGLIGYNAGAVTGCYSTAYVKEYEYMTSQIGGLIGYNDTGAVANSYYERSKGLIGNSAGGLEVGGLIGANRRGAVTNCRVSNVTVLGRDTVGGLIGANYGGTVGWCYYEGVLRINSFDGHIEETDSVSAVNNIAGGLIGLNQGTVTRSFSIKSYVSGTRQVGGLIGVNDNSAIVTLSYSEGYVNGRETQIGGLVGHNAFGSSISQCYSTSEVRGTNGVGGLVGDNGWNSRITESYSAGRVRSLSDTDIGIGGLVGSNANSNNGYVERSFWDQDASARGHSAGGEGLPTGLMKNLYTFSNANWAIDSVWSKEKLLTGNYPSFIYVAPPVISIFRDSPVVRRNGSSTFVPKITIRGRVMDVSALTNSNYQIRIIDMRGKVVARFNVNGSGRCSLGRISAGRYLVETRVNGKVINVLPHNIGKWR